MPFALGNSHAKKLTAETILVEGDLLVAGHIKQAFKEENTEAQDHTTLKTTQTGKLEIGNHETRNTVKLMNFGPKVIFNYDFRFQANTIHTTNNSKNVRLTLLESHGLKIGDTITLRNVSGSEHNGITKEQLTGAFELKEADDELSNTLTITTEGTATQTSSITQFTVDISCNIYSTLDLHDDATTWVRSTTMPGSVIAPDGTRLNTALPPPSAVA